MKRATIVAAALLLLSAPASALDDDPCNLGPQTAHSIEQYSLGLLEMGVERPQLDELLQAAVKVLVEDASLQTLIQVQTGKCPGHHLVLPGLEK